MVPSDPDRGARAEHSPAGAVPEADGPFDVAAFRRALTTRVADAVRTLRVRVGSENLYAFALVTDRERGFTSVVASGNTEEALARAAAARAEHDPRFRGEAGRRLLRWSPTDWEHHDLSEEVRALAFPPAGGRRPGLDAAIDDALLGALRAVDRAGLLGSGADRAFLTVNVLTPFPSRASFRRGLAALNPRPTVERHLHENVPAPFIRCVNRAPRRERLRIWIALYEDLYMEWRTAIAEEARARGMTPWDVEVELERFGAKAVPPLLDLVAHYGFAARIDHDRGLETREVWLAGSALFLARRIGALTEKDLARLQEVLQGFVERDRRLRIASTLAENTARVLHQLRPRRFPEPLMDPLSYKLLNPEPFLPRKRG